MEGLSEFAILRKSPRAMPEVVAESNRYQLVDDFMLS